MKSFLHKDRPILTLMLRPRDNPTAILADIRQGLMEGADAFGLQIESMPLKYRTREIYKEIFAAMEDKPAYITNYIRGSVCPELSDDVLVEQMQEALDCGAALVDIRGDMFAFNTDEITYEEKAVEKQKALIKEIHTLGSEVLMSSHTLRYTTPAEVLKIAEAHQSRGADITKIVTKADNEYQLNQNFLISALLKKEITIPSLFLCGGSHCQRHRTIGPVIGSVMFLCSLERDIPQPYIETALEILTYSGYFSNNK